MTVEETYEALAAILRSAVSGEWTRTVMSIELIDDSIGYNGWLYAPDKSRTSMHLELPFEVWDAIDELHVITTEGGNNRWNRLRYTLNADRSFEVDFIWDEDLAEIMAYINSTTNVPEPHRGDGLDRIKQAQLERKTARIYDNLAHALLHNAPAHAWELLILDLTRPPLHYETRAQTAPGRNESLLLLGEADAVQALEELTQAGDHLGWETATLTVAPTGRYRYSFVWAGAGEFNLPTHYHCEGQIKAEAPAA